MGRVMSDTEIRHRKKIQGHIAQTTGALGLAGIGAFGAARLGGTSKVALKAQKAVPALKRVNPKKADLVALGASTTAGGIGGAGSFNFASYTGAEARKRKPAMPVTTSKSLGVEAPVVGAVGFAKDWKASASKFDSERSRLKRSQAYEDAGTAGAGALAGAAGVKGGQAYWAVAPNWKKGQKKAKHLPNVKAAHAARKAAGVKHGKVGLGLLAASGATGGATLAVKNRNQSRSWAPYSKRSAFGVDHGEVRTEWTAP